MSLFHNRSVRATVLGHLVVDLLNAERPLILAVLCGPLGLSTALIGLVSLLHTISGSLLQPLFGQLVVERVAGRRRGWRPAALFRLFLEHLVKPIPVALRRIRSAAQPMVLEKLIGSTGGLQG